MKFKVLLKYIYASTANPPQNPLSNTIHQIDQEIVTEHVTRMNFILRKADFEGLLEADGAAFDPDSLRIYDETEMTYYHITDDFEIQIDPTAGIAEILLWLRPPKSVELHSKVDQLANDIQIMRSTFESQIKEILTVQKKFADDLLRLTANSVQLTQHSSQISNKSPLSAIALNIPLGKNDSKYSGIRSEGDALLSSQNLNLQTVKSSITTFSEDALGLPTLQKKGSYVDSSKLPQAGSIDMAVLYSEPLVKRVENEIKTQGDPVDYEEECNTLLEILKAKNKRIDLIFQIATKDRLVDVLAKAPPILHIICHGELNQKTGKYYLCFESENGELLEFNSDTLVSIIEKIEISPIKLVFVNACHSEEVAKVFLQAGVPCVIAIQSELRIADNVAKKFSEKFYSHIFDGTPVKPAFDLAKFAAAAANDIHTCCCAHIHKPKCPWYNTLVKTHSYRHAHQYHIPTCTKCPKKNKHIHTSMCEWALGFSYDYKLDPDEAPDYVKSDEIWTCCCSPELPHDESLKFKIFNPSGNADSLVFFANREAGTVTNRNPYSVIEQKFSVKRIRGRNKEMHQLYENLTSKDIKYVQLNGSEGVGKTSLVKQLANYLYERGHFRDRIAIIMMEKTPSISHFKSDLYKEVSAYDFKSFCESIKLSKNLFILEKCDMLLENHKKEFTDTLRQITEASKYTKFIIIKNEFERLQLDETPVMMRDLAPIDAANILISLSYIHLEICHRNPLILAQRQLFQKVRLTPQKIWCISERLKNERLDYIEFEMISRQESNYKTKTEENEEAISKTLESILDKSQTGYKLVLMICLFPSGVSSSDLVQMSRLEVIPSNWAVILKQLLTAEQTRSTAKRKSAIVQSDSDDDGEESEDEEEVKEESKSPAEESQHPKDVQLLKPGNYFWTVIVKDPQQELLYYQPAQFVNKYIDRKMKPEVAHLELRKLQYLTLLALSLIRRMTRANLYHEKLAENSSVNCYGLWAPNPNNSFYQKYIMDQRNLTYIDFPKEGPDSFDLIKIMKVFEFHETNFLGCIDSDTIQTIIQSDGSLYGETLDLIEICWLAIPTLFKLISTRESGARDLALRALTVLELLEIKDNRLLLLTAKLRLFLASVYLHEKGDVEVSISTIHSELEAVEKIRDQFEDETTQVALSYYVAFTKANSYYRHKKSEYLQSHLKKHEDNMLLNLKIDHEQILQLLKECEGLLKNLDYTYDVERCKVANLTGSILWKISKVNDSAIIDRITAAMSGFSAYKLKRLEVQSVYTYARLLLSQLRTLRQKKSGDEIKIKELSDCLAKVKNLFLAKDALMKAQQIRDKSYEARIVKLIDEINVEIRYGYFNVFVLLRAAPIVEFVPESPESQGPGSKLIPKALGFPTKLGSLFKDDIVNALNQKNKLVFLKFDRLTKTTLIEALRDGCRILRLNCQEVYPDEGCIVVEDDLGRAERITHDQLKEIFLKSKPDAGNVGLLKSTTALQQDRCFDLLILATKDGRKTANFFTKELMVPHLITFEFKNKEKDFKHKIYEDECIDRFTQYFYEEIVDGKSIVDSFNSAYTKTFDFLSASFFDSKDNSVVIDLIGVGPILLPEGKDHSYTLYETEQNALPPGKVEDLSKPRCPTNIQKLITPFVGRNIEIDELTEVLYKGSRHFINVTGEPGSGKTAFLLQAAYQFTVHNAFPDGIYYFGLKALLSSKKELTDMMKEVFGSKFENNIKNFFREKKMLLIFDDFDLFYTKNLRFPHLVFCTLRACHIYTIAVTNSQPGGTQGKRGKRQDTEQKQKTIEKEFFKNQQTLQPLSRMEMAYILLSFANADLVTYCPVEVIVDAPVLKKLGGNPKLLLEKLVRKELTIRHRKLEVNPYYLPQVDIDQVIQSQNSMEKLPRTVFNLSWHSKNLALAPTRFYKSASVKVSTTLSTPTSKEHHHANADGRMSLKKYSSKPSKHGDTGFTPKGRRKPAHFSHHIAGRHSAKEIVRYVEISEKDLEHNARILNLPPLQNEKNQWPQEPVESDDEGHDEEDEEEEEKAHPTREEKFGSYLSPMQNIRSRISSRFGKDPNSIAELPEREFNDDLAIYSQEEMPFDFNEPRRMSIMRVNEDNESDSDDEEEHESHGDPKKIGTGTEPIVSQSDPSSLENPVEVKQEAIIENQKDDKLEEHAEGFDSAENKEPEIKIDEGKAILEGPHEPKEEENPLHEEAAVEEKSLNYDANDEEGGED